MADNFYAKYPVGPTAGVSSLNGLTGALTLVAGTNITITPGSGTLTIDASGGGGATTALDNLASTAVNASIVPAANDAIALGSAAKGFQDIFTHGVDGLTTSPLFIESNLLDLQLYSATDTFSLFGSYGATGSKLDFYNNADSHKVRLQPDPALAADVTFTLPSVDGSNGDVLTTNGSGVLSFAPASGGSSMLKSAYTFSDFQDATDTKTINIPIPANTFVTAIIISLETQFSKSGGGSINLLIDRSTGGTFYPITDITDSEDLTYDNINAYDGVRAADGGRGYQTYAVGICFDSCNMQVTMSVTSGTLADLTSGQLNLYYSTASMPS